MFLLTEPGSEPEAPSSSCLMLASRSCYLLSLAFQLASSVAWGGGLWAVGGYGREGRIWEKEDEVYLGTILDRQVAKTVQRILTQVDYLIQMLRVKYVLDVRTFGKVFQNICIQIMRCLQGGNPSQNLKFIYASSTPQPYTCRPFHAVFCVCVWVFILWLIHVRSWWDCPSIGSDLEFWHYRFSIHQLSLTVSDLPNYGSCIETKIGTGAIFAGIYINVILLLLLFLL